MGLLPYDALVLAKTACVIERPQRVLTLGVPTLNFRSADFCHILTGYPEIESRMPRPWEFADHVGFFRGLGFAEVDALDISDYEGAGIIGDLNDAELPSQIGKSFDLIYDSGTIEHIFDAPTALRSLSRLLNVGGAIVHATPANGFMDHGLWQLSPDLFRTYYRAAGFEILTSAVFVFADTPYAMRADSNFYRQHGRKYIVENFPEAIAVFAAIKMRESVPVQVTMQDYYKAMHEAEATVGNPSSFFLEYGPNEDARAREKAAAIKAASDAGGSSLSRIWRRFAG